MGKRKQKEQLFEFSHKRKGELEGWLMIDGRLDEVCEALDALTVILRDWSRQTVSPPLAEGVAIQIRSLYCFAAITYIRCFSSGRRPRLDIAQVRTVTAKDRELHEDIRTMRNQYLAHAVADEEGAHVYLHAKPEERKPTGFLVLAVALASDGRPAIRRFAALSRKVRAFVRRCVASAGNDIARAFLGPGATWAKYLHHAKRKEDGLAPSVG